MSQVSCACLHRALQLPGVQAEDAALTQHGRNAHSQLGLEAVPELIKLLGTQSTGVTLQGSGFIWSLCHFPQCSRLWRCHTETTEVPYFREKKDFNLMLEKKLLHNSGPTPSLEVWEHLHRAAPRLMSLAGADLFLHLWYR